MRSHGCLNRDRDLLTINRAALIHTFEIKYKMSKYLKLIYIFTFRFSMGVLFQAKTQPFNILVASENYKRGHGKRSKLKWEPDGDIIQALDCAFCKTISVNDTLKKAV